jgi:copper(I)-binding protein
MQPERVKCVRLALVLLPITVLVMSCGSDSGDVEQDLAGIVVSDVWARPARLLGAGEHEHQAEATEDSAADAGTNGVVYLTIENESSEPDRLIAARAEVSSTAELHMVSVDQGVMQMRQVEGGIELPAGEKVRLEPAGLHIMLIDLTRSLELGDEFDVSLTFERAGELTVRAEVRDQ